MYMYSRVPKTCVYTKCIAKYALILTINVVATFKNKNILSRSTNSFVMVFIWICTIHVQVYSV